MLVKIREKGQITIPAAFVKQGAFKAGDLVEASVSRKGGALSITLTKVVVRKAV